MFNFALILAQTANEGTTEAVNNALWQYPVAALLIVVVVLFVRDRKKSDERHADTMREAEERHERFLAETNEKDREDRQIARESFSDVLISVQDRSENSARVMTDTFRKTTEEQTKNASAQLSRTIDALDRNTEAFGKISGVLSTMEVASKDAALLRAAKEAREARESSEIAQVKAAEVDQ